MADHSLTRPAPLLGVPQVGELGSGLQLAKAQEKSDPWRNTKLKELS